jgi:hypothetical protein
MNSSTSTFCAPKRAFSSTFPNRHRKGSDPCTHCFTHQDPGTTRE